MSSAEWFFLVGALMLAMGMSAPLIRRWHLTTAIVYLAVGVLIGPTGFGLFHFNPLKESELLEILTEAAVLISLFSAGVKMPVPVTFTRWRAPISLAFVSMASAVGLVAAFAHFALGLSWGAAVLLGAIIAPTDPVLATDVQIRHPEDRDRLRFTLTCEAGMNDGSAFPFVMLGLGLLGLHDLGDVGARWLLVDVFWATGAAIAIGVVCGWGLAKACAEMRGNGGSQSLLHDFLGLGLIGTVYGLSELAEAWGFLAVFFAAVALRQTELRLTGSTPETRDQLQTDALGPEAPDPVGADLQRPDPRVSGPGEHVSEASLVFQEHLERISELVLILLIGGMLFVDSWSWRAAGLALFVFLVARPASVALGLAGTGLSWRMRSLAGWFGVRGIGSLYYLMYAVEHGLPEEVALELIHLVLVVVTLSIIVHGLSMKPMMGRLWQRAAAE